MLSAYRRELTKNRNYIPLIFVIFALPLLASILVYYFSDEIELKRKNFGTLLTTPVPISSLGLIDREEGGGFQNAIDGRWVLIYLSDTHCSDQCLKDLSSLEKVRTALGKDYRRTALLLLEPSSPKTEYTGSSRQFPVAVIDDRHKRKLAAVSGSLLFLADDHQNVIMSYAEKIDQKAVYDDLRWLLKVNRGAF